MLVTMDIEKLTHANIREQKFVKLVLAHEYAMQDTAGNTRTVGALVVSISVLFAGYVVRPHEIGSDTAFATLRVKSLDEIRALFFVK